MRLTVLGAGPAYTDRRGSSGACYLLCEGSTHILLDIGQGRSRASSNTWPRRPSGPWW